MVTQHVVPYQVFFQALRSKTAKKLIYQGFLPLKILTQTRKIAYYLSTDELLFDEKHKPRKDKTTWPRKTPLKEKK